ncbi:uncharacterized protein J3D65DRAFT_699974 [Phyllosticta citribraziliensis]|uniref:Uncharacterized protein n=1 Tax=Phyllosticta citribraziliensis TaxID=989973 RepID=A0ABR1LNP1_9PEZI
MFRFVARARPCVALPKIKPPLLRPSYALANTFALSTKHSSSRLPKKDLQFFDENEKQTNEKGAFKSFTMKLSEGEESAGQFLKILHSADGDLKYMRYQQFSEVATLHFLRTVLKLPVPEAKIWINQDLGAAFCHRAVLMDFAEGIPASSAKEILQKDVVTRTRLTHSGWQIEKRVSSFTFDRYGSIYRPSSDFMYEVPEGQKAKVLHGASPEEKQLTESEFYIGRSCESMLFKGDDKHLMEEYHGPWTCAYDYVESRLRCQIECLSKKMNTPDNVDKSGTPYEYHIELLQRALSIVPFIMPKDNDLTSPKLHHPVLSIDDLYVDEKFRVKTVIGWRSSWIGPAFASLNWALKLTPGDEDLNPEKVIKQLKSKVSGEELGELSQTLWEQSAMLRKALKEPILPLLHIGLRTQRFGTLPLEVLLMHVKAHWKRFGAPVPCPYRITDEEIKMANQKMDKFAEAGDKRVAKACMGVGLWTVV